MGMILPSKLNNKICRILYKRTMEYVENIEAGFTYPDETELYEYMDEYGLSVNPMSIINELCTPDEIDLLMSNLQIVLYFMPHIEYQCLDVLDKRNEQWDKEYQSYLKRNRK